MKLLLGSLLSLIASGQGVVVVPGGGGTIPGGGGGGSNPSTAVYLTRATDQAGTDRYCRSTTGNATYTCSVTPALTTYGSGGSCLVLNANFANVTTATINVNSLGAKSILTRAGTSLSAGDITADKPITICYDGTQYIIQGDGGSGASVVAGTGIGVAGTTVSIDPTVVTTLANLQSGVPLTGTDSGGDDTYVVALSPVLSAYTTNQCLILSVTTTNTGAATIDAGPGVKTITKFDGTTLANGDIVAIAPNQICYDGSNFRLQRGGSGGTTVTSTPPYLTISGSLYLPQFGYAATAPPASGSWTSVNSANALASGGNGSLLFTGKNTTGATTGYKIALSGSTTVEAAISCVGMKAGGSAYWAGIGVMDTGGAFFALGSGPGGLGSDVSSWTNSTTNSFYSDAPITASIFQKISMSGTTATFSTSTDGVNWKTHLNTRTITATDWMIGSSGNGTDAATCNLLSWKTT